MIGALGLRRLSLGSLELCHGCACQTLANKFSSTSSISCSPNEESPNRPKKVRMKSKDTPLRIYTRTGDGGNSSLFTGERRPKSDIIFEALGSIDELSSHIGLSMEYAQENNHDYVENLQRVQCILQDVGSALATPFSSARNTHLEKTTFNKRHTEELEETSSCPEASGKTSSSLHITRSVCRRAERRIAPLASNEEVDKELLKYVNRLSDFLFTMARYAAQTDEKEETIYTRPDVRIKGPEYSARADGLWKKA
ncbi:hypothetical protein TCAL_01498 [Tigriopus californicus]|uniref:Corrinoid adenosyltransferase MMAB n=1 Tax=Tigriopus californicus TaxID=6832 RepID=A0A553N6W0_TIGCA|nr:hypothetical protein TCAL_01498 [Tigriopus californicus]